MASQSNVNELARLITRLQQERQEHVDAIAGIDAAFQSLGISPKTTRRGRKPKILTATSGRAKSKRGRRRRGKFAQTSEQFVASLLPNGKKLSTAEINKHWTASGRKNRADITLGKMVKEGKLKRHKVKGERGSLYSLGK